MIGRHNYARGKQERTTRLYGCTVRGVNYGDGWEEITWEGCEPMDPGFTLTEQDCAEALDLAEIEDLYEAADRARDEARDRELES